MQGSLTAKTIGEIGEGDAAEQINEQLKRAIADTLRRGREDGTKRVVTIKVTLEYAGEVDGNDQYRASLSAAFAPPPFVAKPTLGEIDAAAKYGPALLFDMAEVEA